MMRAAGNTASSARSGSSSSIGGIGLSTSPGVAPRLAVKRRLISAVLGYRRTVTIALALLTRAQLARGGGPELVIVGRSTDT
jgi:hypothetical protein